MSTPATICPVMLGSRARLATDPTERPMIMIRANASRGLALGIRAVAAA